MQEYNYEAESSCTYVWLSIAFKFCHEEEHNITSHNIRITHVSSFHKSVHIEQPAQEGDMLGQELLVENHNVDAGTVYCKTGHVLGRRVRVAGRGGGASDVWRVVCWLWQSERVKPRPNNPWNSQFIFFFILSVFFYFGELLWGECRGKVEVIIFWTA